MLAIDRELYIKFLINIVKIKFECKYSNEQNNCLLIAKLAFGSF